MTPKPSVSLPHSENDDGLDLKLPPKKAKKRNGRLKYSQHLRKCKLLLDAKIQAEGCPKCITILLY